MVDVPRRLTLSGAEKVAVIADRAAPGSHRGNTNWSKPPTAKTPTPQSSSTGPVMTATYQADSPSLGFHIVPTHLFDSDGPADQYSGIDGSNAVNLTADAWYTAAGSALVTGAIPGDVYQINLIAPTAYDTFATVTVGPSKIGDPAFGDANLYVATMPFIVTAASFFTVQLIVDQITGTTPGTYSFGRISLTAQLSV